MSNQKAGQTFRKFRTYDIKKTNFLLSKMSNPNTPALLLFADNHDSDKDKDSIYKYLADAGFDPDEVKNWGKIGSLVDALKEDDRQECTGCTLDQSFLDFVAKLPPGNTPKPTIRHQMQRLPPI